MLSVFAEGLDHPGCVAVHPDGSVWCGGEEGQISRLRRAYKLKQRMVSGRVALLNSHLTTKTKSLRRIRQRSVSDTGLDSGVAIDRNGDGRLEAA